MADRNLKLLRLLNGQRGDSLTISCTFAWERARDVHLILYPMPPLHVRHSFQIESEIGDCYAGWSNDSKYLAAINLNVSCIHNDNARIAVGSCYAVRLIEAAFFYPPKGRIYFFCGSTYVRWHPDNAEVDRTNSIGGEYWRGVESGFDVAVWHPVRGFAYFFKNEKYQRYVPGEGVDATKRINEDGWLGLWTTGMDAAIPHPDGTLHFFRGNRYRVFDFQRNVVVDDGRIGTNYWNGVWTNGIDSAVYHPVNNRAYFFQNDSYLEFSFESNSVVGQGVIAEDGWRGL